MELKRIENPFVFEFKNDNGSTCLMDASPEIGGKNKGFRPMELLAASLVGCMSIDIIAILNKKRIEPELYTMNVIGIRNETTPKAFNTLEVELHIDKTIDRALLEKTIGLVHQKYCSVAASLHPDIKIDYKITQR
jgi:putative redox protein